MLSFEDAPEAKPHMLTASQLCGGDGHKGKHHSDRGKCQMRQTQEGWLYVRVFPMGEVLVLPEEEAACTETLSENTSHKEHEKSLRGRG